MSESPLVSAAATGMQPAVAEGPPGCAAVAGGGRETVLAATAVLRAGGNAVDAALAGSLAACVSEVIFTSLGGGGFLNVCHPDGSAEVLDFFVNTPGLGTPGKVGAPEFTPVTVRFTGTEQVFHVGPGSVAVPGVLAGLLEANRRFGRVPMATVVQPAIALAEQGAVLEPIQASVLDLVREIMSSTQECNRLVSTDAGPAVAGDTLHNQELAGFLTRIGAGEVTSMTSTPFADPLLELMGHTAGHVTAADLADYRVAIREPLVVRRRGASIALNTRPAFGGEIVARALENLAPVDGSVSDWERAAGALQDATAETRRIDLADGGTQVSRGTTQISVVDADGMVASMTTSNGSGSGVMIPGTGIHLNNMLGEEDLNPGGFHALPAGQRMGSMMAPTVLTAADGAVTALGTGGSERIRSALLMTLLRVVDLGLDTPAAVAAPRLHPAHNGVQMEPGWPARLAADLRQSTAVNIWPGPNLFFGGVHAATRHADGSVTAVGDSRRGGAAAVVPVSG